ncbi:MAG: Smr/MutS family protein [Bacilli bacterium]|jgi:DNA-nicking Smr family endonuclease|nr:Smr/MutS family protein [Bacilli bacterium]
MNLNDVIFIDRFPKLDLHGYDRETARVAIQDFIRDQRTLKQPIIVIIHGIGYGILRSTTNEVLRSHKMVIDYKSFYYNHGCTIVQIKID